MAQDVVEAIYARAVELSRKVEENFIELGELLGELNRNHPDGFRKLIKSTGLGQRKAYYLMDIERAFRAIPVAKSRLRRIGWTKLLHLAKHVTQANHAEMLQLAEGNTARELQMILKGEAPQESLRCVLMYFSPEDHELLSRALLRHGGTKAGRGLYDKEKALMNIVRKVLEDGGREGPGEDASRPA